jgi:eukaryotic-like serine/threonine-protein kinase
VDSHAPHVTERTLRDLEHAPSAPSELPLAGRYRLRGILGRGGMGTVYRAEDLQLGEIIALKIVAKGTSSSLTDSDHQRDEVKLARRVTHRNVARTFDIGEHEGLRFITMELVDGTSLREIIESDTPLERKLGLIAHVASGLAAIHDAGVAHRDLKPENVLVAAAGIAKITDFGIARDAGSLESGMTTGTPRYMAPEVLAGAAPTRAADVYAFGLVAYETLTRERFRGGEIEPAMRTLRGVLGDSRKEVVAFIGRCLAEAPELRPTSVRVLEGLLADEPSAAPGTVDLAALRRPARARLGASVFAADAADVWLSDSVPSEIIRALTRFEGLEVVTTLLPLERASSPATTLGIDVVIMGSVRRTGKELVVSMRAVSTSDQLQLWARRVSLTMDRLSAGLREVAELIAGAVLDRESPERTTVEVDPRVTELVLRAAHEDHDPWRDFSDRAATYLEEARALAPDDPAVLAALANALLRGVGMYDSARFIRARTAADRAVELDPASPDSQLALGVLLFHSNDPLGAMTSLRSALSSAPSLVDVHAVVAAMAVDVGLFHDGIGRASLVMALYPGHAITRTTATLAREYVGEQAAADALVEAGLSSDAPLDRILSALAGSRLAIWRGTPAAMSELLRRFEPLRGTPFIDPFIAGLEGSLRPPEVIARLGAFGHIEPEWARPRCVRTELEIELSIHQGELAEAARKIEELIAAGSYNEAWFTKCPAVERLAASVDISAARELVVARAASVRRALAEAGLMAVPRRRARR